MAVPGLRFYPSFVGTSTQLFLLEFCENNSGLLKGVTTSDKARQVIQYGFAYDYKNPANAPRRITPVPTELVELLNIVINPCLTAEGFTPFEIAKTQIIINRYLPGQGISAHTDSLNFKEKIISLTLGVNNSSRAMVFQTEGETGNQKVEIVTRSGDLYMMTGDARYKWTHCMPARKNDVIEGVKIPRDVIWSITFREVK